MSVSASATNSVCLRKGREWGSWKKSSCGSSILSCQDSNQYKTEAISYLISCSMSQLLPSKDYKTKIIEVELHVIFYGMKHLIKYESTSVREELQQSFCIAAAHISAMKRMDSVWTMQYATIFIPSAQVLQQQLVHHHGLCWTTVQIHLHQDLLYKWWNINWKSRTNSKPVCIMLMPQNPEETGEPGSPE